MSIRSVSDREKCTGLHYCIVIHHPTSKLSFAKLFNTVQDNSPMMTQAAFIQNWRSDLTWCTSIHTVMMAGQANLDALAGAPTKGSGWEALASLVALFHSCKMILGTGMIMDQPESKVPIVMQIIFGPTAPSWQKSLLLQFSWCLVPLKQSPVVWLPYQIRYFEAARIESKYPALFGCLFGGHGWSDTWIG